MLFHIGLITFHFHFPTLKVDLVVMSMTLRNHYCSPSYLKASKKDPTHFQHIIRETAESQQLFLQKTSAGQFLRSVLSYLENLEYGINLFQITWNGHVGPRNNTPDPLRFFSKLGPNMGGMYLNNTFNGFIYFSASFWYNNKIPISLF